MVRPAVRFRPAARRGANLQVNPVWIKNSGLVEVSRPSSYVLAGTVYREAASHLATIISGELGEIASFNAFAISPPELATESNQFTGQKMLDFWYTVYPDGNYPIGGGDFSNLSTWSIVQQSALRTFVAPVQCHAIDATVYLTLMRGSLWQWRDFLDTNFGLVYDSGSHYSSAVYDLLTVGINTQTGQLSPRVSALFSHQLQVHECVNFGGGQGSARFSYTWTRDYEGMSVAMADSLPDTHPYKACGALPWVYLDAGISLAKGQTIIEEEATEDFGQFASLPNDVGFANFKRKAQDEIEPMPYGYSTAANRRAIVRFKVWELSVIDSLPAGSDCERLPYLARHGLQSFSDYEQAALELATDVAELTGLSEADQNAAVVDQTEASGLPSVISPSNPDHGVFTSDPLYFALELPASAQAGGYPDFTYKQIVFVD